MAEAILFQSTGFRWGPLGPCLVNNLDRRTNLILCCKTHCKHACMLLFPCCIFARFGFAEVLMLTQGKERKSVGGGGGSFHFLLWYENKKVKKQPTNGGKGNCGGEKIEAWVDHLVYQSQSLWGRRNLFIDTVKKQRGGKLLLLWTLILTKLFFWSEGVFWDQSCCDELPPSIMKISHILACLGSPCSCELDLTN